MDVWTVFARVVVLPDCGGGSVGRTEGFLILRHPDLPEGVRTGSLLLGLLGIRRMSLLGCVGQVVTFLKREQMSKCRGE